MTYFGDGEVGEHRASAKRHRARTAAWVFFWAGMALIVTAGSAYGEWRHAFGYGWPGPYQSENAALNGGETVWKAQFWSVLSLLVVIGAAIGAGFAAQAARQRVWLVILIGVSITLGAALTIAVLLTPVPTSS